MNLLCMIFFTRCGEFIANTTEGPVIGFQVESRSGRKFYGFAGIPYAKPPVGELRFEDPQPPEIRTKPKNALFFGPSCMQSLYLVSGMEDTVQGREDCLYLSVYSHNLNPPKLYPVLVYFHGGNYDRGHGQFQSRPQYFMDGDVVVVTLDYRTSILGFLTTEDEALPGNYGLKDQHMALKWIQRNIKNFGGDPNRITLYGESSGGACVHHQMISPWSKGLFHGGIMESGTALTPWSVLPKGVGKYRATVIAKELGCSVDSSEEIRICLKKADAKKLIRTIKLFKKNLLETLSIFTPVVDSYLDKPFMPKDPHYLKLAPLPLMILFENMDGLIKTVYFTKNPSYYDKLDKHFTELMPKILYNDVNIIPKSAANKIRKFYLGEKPVSPATAVNVTNIITDSWYLWPILKTLRRHSGPHYLIMNEYEPANSPLSYLGNYKLANGSFHMDVAYHLWDGRPVISYDRPADMEFSKFLVNLWDNFIIHGTPTPSGFKFHLPEWDEAHQKYMKISNNGVTIEERVFDDRANLWSTILQH